MASIVVAGDTSGTITLAAPAVSGTTTLTLPTTSGTVLTNNNATVGSSGITFSDSSTQTAAASPFGLKNRIINGDMRIDQRNNGASVTPVIGVATYTLDRFYSYVPQSSKLTIQQNAGSVTPPVGFTQYLGVTSSSAYSILSTDQFLVGQAIEGLNIADLDWGTANAKTVTLSFWVRSSLTGTFGGAIQNSAQNRSYPFSYTIASANTWTQISVTIAGDTSGTWLTTNGTGMYVFFGLGVGSTLSATAGSWQTGNFNSATGAVSVVGTNAATWYITGVQLERNTTATPFEWLPYSSELALCQRYYRKTATSATNAYCEGTLFGYSLAGLSFGMVFPFPVTMRTTPSVAVYGTWTRSNITATKPTVEPAGNSAYFTYIAPTASGSFNMFTAGNVNNYIDFNAEL